MEAAAAEAAAAQLAFRAETPLITPSFEVTRLRGLVFFFFFRLDLLHGFEPNP